MHRSYSTTSITPELLAALAQVEGAGNPVARIYWRSILGSCRATPSSSQRCFWTATSRRFLRAGQTPAPTRSRSHLAHTLLQRGYARLWRESRGDGPITLSLAACRRVQADRFGAWEHLGSCDPRAARSRRRCRPRGETRSGRPGCRPGGRRCPAEPRPE